METFRVRRVPGWKTVLLASTLGVSMGLFTYLPFAIAFIVIGAIVSALFAGVTGIEVDFILLLFMQYLVMLLAMIISIHFYCKRYP